MNSFASIDCPFVIGHRKPPLARRVAALGSPLIRMALPALLLALLVATTPFSVAASASAIKQRANVLQARVETGSTFNIVAPDYADGSLVLILKSDGGPVKGTLLLGARLRSSDPVVLALQGEVQIPASGELRWPIPAALIGRTLGMRYVDWRIDAPPRSEHGVVSLTLMRPVGPTKGPDKGDGFIFGIAGGMRFNKDTQFKENYFRAAGLIGCKAVRMDLSWNALQPSPDTWRWEGLDECVAIAEKNGVFIQPLLAYGNAWALTPESRRRIEEWRREGKGQPSDELRMLVTEGAWKGFCTALAGRYGTRMQYYEIWNEADILNFWRGTPEEYVTLLKWSYEAIKAVDPKIIVTTSGFATLKHPRHNPQVFEATFRDGGAHFDVIAWHQHHVFPTFHRSLDQELLPKIRGYGLQDKPIVFNETAVGMNFPQEWTLATTLIKKLTFLWSRGAIGHYWYNLTASHPEFYMLNPGWTPRPSFPAYNEMSRQLRGRKFVRQADLGPDRWCFIFNGRGAFQGASDRDYVAVAWSENEQERGTPLMFRVGDASRAWEVDLMGNRRELTVAAGRVAAAVAPEPKYIVVEGASIPLEVAPALLEFASSSLPIVIGEVAVIGMTVRNPLSQPATVDLQWTLPSTLEQVRAGPAAIPLQAGEAKDCTLAVRLPARSEAAEMAVQVMAKLRQQPLRSDGIATLLPIRRASSAPSHDNEPPMFAMVRAEQVINHHNILPNTQHLSWGGPRDVSGKAWIYLEGDALCIRVTVTDDKHHQKGIEAELLDGDAVQLALAVPGRPDAVEVACGTPDGRRTVLAVRSVFRGMNEAQFAAGLQASVAPVEGGFAYTLKMPSKVMSLQPADLRKGIRLNVAIHDHDGEAKKGLIRAGAGLGDALDPRRFPLVVFE